MNLLSHQIIRRPTIEVTVENIIIGGNNPIAVQSMTDTDTANIEQSTLQIIDLVKAGSEIVRLTVNNEAAAKAVPYIKENIIKAGFNVALVGCFHYNGHELLNKHPACATALAKYRINPGNVGFGNNQDKNYASIIENAIKNNKAVRIGVNWGSLDKKIAANLMDENAKSENPQESNIILRKALVMSCLQSAKAARNIGLSENKIILSCKVSQVQDLIAIYRTLSHESNYPLHLGLTEAGLGSKAVVASSAALAILLQEGIGDTIRISLTPDIGAKRSKEVTVAQEILQTMGIRNFRPLVTSCPGCGRTSSDYFRKLAAEVQDHINISIINWKQKYPGVEKLNIAVMGCIVNGPGESKHADIGISLPGSNESPSAPVFIDGTKHTTLKGDNIAAEFKDMLDEYISRRFA